MRQLFLIILMIPIVSLANQVNRNDTILEMPSYDSKKVLDSTMQSVQKEDTLFHGEMKAKIPLYKEHLPRVDSLQIVLQEKDKLEKEIVCLKEALDKADKCLVSVAANSLYLPYEAYSIREVAIRSFETVHDAKLRGEQNIKYRLLKTYSKDVKGLLTFITECKREIEKNRFTHDANEQLQSFKTKDFYISYHEYDDWKSTFLGRMIFDVETQLKQFDRNTHRLNFDDMIRRLQDCINTENDL